MFVLLRAVTYATLFIGLVLIFLPGRVLSSAGVPVPAAIGAWQVAGMLVGVAGAALALSCILTFAFVGKGTPAPFDPPRRLVVRGPYRFVRNPMYVGAGLALAGAALFYRSLALLGYVVLFVLVMHLFVVVSEEPILRRTFGHELDWTVPRDLPDPVYELMSAMQGENAGVPDDETYYEPYPEPELP